MADNQKVIQGNKIREIRKKMGYSQGEFAKLLNLKQGSYSNVERGDNAISTDVFTILANKLNIDVNQILKEDGEVDYAINNIRMVEQNTPNVRFFNIEAFAGLAIHSGMPEVSEWLYVPTLEPHKTYYALPVSGNSMNPTLSHEDFLICEHILDLASDFVHGKIYVAVLRDKIVVKRIFIIPLEQALELRSDNPFFKPERISVEDLIKLFKVIKVISTPKEPNQD